MLLLQIRIGDFYLFVCPSVDELILVRLSSYLVAAASVQCLWSLAVAILDAYAIVVKRSFRIGRAVIILALGDWVTGTLIFSAACGSAAITTLLSNDFGACSVNPCASFMNATAMAFLSWLARAPAFIGNLWTAVHRIQKS
uniref:CASP-like protein n=1 Tax=Aegilops tauschii subsp. strangulata TaxID=200361 RepID=A0A453DFG1_AEGTS